jgi:hypothetical protein
MFDKTEILFRELYNIFHGYNYFEYDDSILFDFVNTDDEYQTVKYNKNTKSITTFVNNRGGK